MYFIFNYYEYQEVWRDYDHGLWREKQEDTNTLGKVKIFKQIHTPASQLSSQVTVGLCCWLGVWGAVLQC